MVRPGPIIIITAKSLVNVNVTAMVMPRDAQLQQSTTAQKIKYITALPTARIDVSPSCRGQQREQLIKWRDQPNGMAIIENFANYLRTGYLFASPVIIELYCWFTEFNRRPQTGEVQQRYQHFVNGSPQN